nr:hypothetical protein BaRGS_011141 [Batillaria attramentaria]
MGVYLAVIGVADRLYQGNYLWEDTAWKNSVACKLAGFFSLLSNEVSAFIICLITLDRFLVIRFPFHDVHFRVLSSHLASSVAWVLGLALATLPLLLTGTQGFYGQTGICIPLPITKNKFHGEDYSFGVLIVLNFVLFVLIAVGQILIYCSVQANSMATGDPTRRSRDMVIARRLFTIVMSDFLCWFPVGLLGLMASSGVEIPGETNVALVVFVLPVNSTLNPFLYTFNMIMEKRKEEQEKRLKRQLILEMEKARDKNIAELPAEQLTEEDIRKCFLGFLRDGLLDTKRVMEHCGGNLN